MDTIILTLLAAGGIYVGVSIVLWVLQVVAHWKIFSKAGEAGWKSIIPVYSGYISYKIAWKPVMFWLSLIATFVTSFASNMYAADESSMGMLLVACVAGLVSAIINIMYSVKLARAFGRGVGFVLGLIFLQPLFVLILGLGSSEYKGADL